MATVKEIIDGFCALQNLPTYTSYVGATAPAQLQYLEILRFIGDKMVNMPLNFPQLKRGYTFLTQTGVRQYELPGDFYKLLPATQWDLTNQEQLIGPLSDYQYTENRYGVVALGTNKAFRLIGPSLYQLLYNGAYNQFSSGTFEIDVAGANNTDQLYMEYISRNWVWPQNWAPTTGYTTGDLRTGIKHIYRCDASGTSGTDRPDWSTGSDSDGAVDWTVYHEPYTWTADTDIVLFDRDVMIEGMTWKFLMSKNLEFLTQRQDWENSIRSAAARFNGSKIINAGENQDGELLNVSDGSWNV